MSVSESLLVNTLANIDVRFNGSRAVLSGPAGGVVGYALTTYSVMTGQPVIGFDMGGESTLLHSHIIIVVVVVIGQGQVLLPGKPETKTLFLNQSQTT